MRILHTADLHLRAEDDERWDAMCRVLEVAATSEVDVVAIAGDLYDRHGDAPRLRTRVRDLFGQHDFQIVVLPGNHDDGLKEGDFYGENVHVIRRFDDFLDIGETRFFGLPYENISGERILERLVWMQHHTRPNATNVLLYHGELIDVLFSRRDFGEEDPSYMPVRLSYFEGLGFDYVLAGHFHTNFDIRRFKTQRGEGYFVYPGSPISITRKETGVRKVNLLTPGAAPQAIELDTPHYQEVTVSLHAFDDADPIEHVREQIAAAHANARVLLTVEGSVQLQRIDKTEADFAAALKSLMDPRVEPVSLCWRDVSEAFDDEIFKRCMTKLDALELDESERTRVKHLILESVTESAREN